LRHDTFSLPRITLHPFSAAHHRRSRSLKERRGVEERIGGLPGSARYAVMPLHTIACASNMQCRSLVFR